MKLLHYCFQRQNSCPGLTDAVPRLWSITLRITKPTSSSRLCQIGQTIKSKAWQASKPARPGSHRPQLPAHGGPDWPEPPHPRLRPEADILQRKRKEKPRARTADLRAINATSPPPPGARAPKAKLPSCSLSRSRHRSPRLPPPQPSRRGPARREAWAAACAGAPPSPHPPEQPAAPVGKGSRAELPPVLPPSLPSGEDERTVARRAKLPSARPLPGPAAPSCGAAGRRRWGSGSPGAAMGPRRRNRLLRGGGGPV